jgi:nitrogenase molybdenum-iron protein NifN
MKAEKNTDYTVTTNACKLCTPLGASLAFRGIENAVPLLHGSQGCSTYIRRYLISHFKEPIDIASSNFGEMTAVFGGGVNLKLALKNITRQYEPKMIGVSTTCLSETIGDDVPMFLQEYWRENKDEDMPALVHVSTPSYQGTHVDGFHNALKSLVDSLTIRTGIETDAINLFPGMLSPADLRHLKEILSDFGNEFTMLPDYSDTLDGGLWREYQKIPEGGTPVSAIRAMGNAAATIELGSVLSSQESAGKLLKKDFDIPCFSLGLPIGVSETDKLFDALETITGKPTTQKYIEERNRLLDSYADGHKYVFEARAIVYGEEDLVIGLVSFLNEIGVVPVLCASGGKSGYFKEKIRKIIPDFEEKGIRVKDGIDYGEILKEAAAADPDFLIGSSKGYSIARKIKKPLIRVGFPIHDRVGGHRILHVGYRGAQMLFDRIANTILETRQEASSVGYSYM